MRFRRRSRLLVTGLLAVALSLTACEATDDGGNDGTVGDDFTTTTLGGDVGTTTLAP